MELNYYQIKVDADAKTLGFWEPDYFLCNVYEGAPFLLDGVEYDSVDRYYQSQRFIGYAPELVDQILQKDDEGKFVLSSVDCALLGGENQVQQNPEWACMKDKTVERAIRAKVGQNPKIQQVLIHSRGWYLYEDVPEGFKHEDYVPYWGLTNGKGENKNGEILMKIRMELVFDKYYQDSGLIERNRDTYWSLRNSLGLNSGTNVSWFDIYKASVMRRAGEYGLPSDMAPHDALLHLERVFQEEAMEVVGLRIGINKKDNYSERWKKIAANYRSFYEGLSDEEQCNEDLRRKTAMFLEMNKYTASWEEIMQELADLGVEPGTF